MDGKPHRRLVAWGQGVIESPYLGRLELPTSRLSDMRLALVGARQRWEIGGFGRFCAGGRSPALVGDDTGCVTAAAQRRPHKSILIQGTTDAELLNTVLRVLSCGSEWGGAEWGHVRVDIP